jgi:hypothetical protein
MGQTNSLVLLGDGPERLPNQAMDIGFAARLRTFVRRLELRIRLDSSVSICACDPFDPTSQTEEDVRAKYNTLEHPIACPLLS